MIINFDLIKFKSEKFKYAFYGVLFGLLFPVLSTFFETYLQHKSINLFFLLQVQLSTPLLWVIDSAPFFLGLFASFAGAKQDVVSEKNKLLNEDLKAARLIQEYFLPNIPGNKKIQLDYRYIPIREVSGDFFLIKELKNKSIGLFIGDVSGHGITAALLTSLTIALIHKVENVFDFDPDFFMEQLNNELLQFIPDNKYITGIYGYFYQLNNLTYFTYSRGGHPYPILWDSEKKEAFLIDSEGCSIGFEKDLVYELNILKLKKNDFLFLFTDGIIEAADIHGNELGFNGLIAIINSVCQKKHTLSKVLDEIIMKINNDENKKKIHDDIILVGLTF